MKTKVILSIEVDNQLYREVISFDKSVWKIQAGAYFNYPVDIGGNLCFIKRFEHQPPGWNLVKSLNGENHVHLPKVYFAGVVQEDYNKYVHYLVTEYCEGETLSDMLAKQNVSSCLLLPPHIIKSLKAIHKKGYWFADLCEKNIFWDIKKQRFILINLDSCKPLRYYPSNIPNTLGYIRSQEFAINTVHFFREEMNKKKFEFNSLEGNVLNYFQVVFLSAKIGFYRSHIQSLKNTSYSTLKEENINNLIFDKVSDILTFKEHIRFWAKNNINIYIIIEYCKLLILTAKESQIYSLNYIDTINKLNSLNTEISSIAWGIARSKHEKIANIKLKEEGASNKYVKEYEIIH